MAQSIHTTIEIKASKAVIWEVLTDFKKYHEWNPFIQRLSGILEVGKHLDVHIGKMHFKPEVLSVDEFEGFKWKGKLWFKGVFDGEHWFRIEELEEEKCLLHHGENFTGALVPFMKKMITGETREGFESMNEALKRRVLNLR